MIKILFVCTGNICRSPTADGILRHKIEAMGLGDVFSCESAGTHGYHIGEAPDRRSQAIARQRGYDISMLRARQLTPEDFDRFDLILGLDRGHVRLINHMKPRDSKAQVALFLEYAGMEVVEVPDPYYGGTKDFEYVLDLVEEGMEKLISRL